MRVTIRVAATVAPHRGAADVIREIADEQRSRGFSGRSAEDLRAEDDASMAEDAERDRELCSDVFLTNEDQLANFPDITVEELP